MTARIKPQYVDEIPKRVKGELGKILPIIDKRGVSDDLMKKL